MGKSPFTVSRHRLANMANKAILLIAAGLTGVAASALAVALVVAGGSYVEPPPGLPDPGPLVVWGSSALRLATELAAIMTIGWLLAASIIDPSSKEGVVSRSGRSDLVRASIAALAWAVLAIVQAFFLVADVLGLPLTEAMSPEIFSTYALEIPAARALIATALLAIVVAVGAFTTSTTGAGLSWLLVGVVAAVLPALAGHGAGLGDHALALTSGVAHIAAAVLWVGGLVALGIHAVRRDFPLTRPIERFSAIALTAFVLIAVSGLANAYTRLESPAQLFTTGYGQVTLSKVVLLVGLAGIAWVMRSRMARNVATSSRALVFARLAGLELTVMAIAIGLGVALATTSPPRVESAFQTLGESLLGFAYPPEPTIASVSLGFRMEPFLLAASLLAASAYCVGVARLLRRGDRWSWGRTVSWLLGIGIVIWCTNSNIAVYAQVSVGLHMVQHMTLTMLAPIMLVLGAPATLALRALRPAPGNDRGPREWLVWFLHSRLTGVLTNPFFVFFLYVIGLYGLYFTPLFGWLMGSHVGHIAMQVHFILAGYLFYWVLIGIDPRPKPLPYWGRLMMLLLALSIHGFFAVAMMMGTQPMASEWYGVVRPPWMADPLQDTLNGGQVAWGLSEIPTLIVLIVIAVQWARSDDREAVRRDRQADRDGDAELTAYNERLTRLAGRDSAS